MAVIFREKYVVFLNITIDYCSRFFFKFRMTATKHDRSINYSSASLERARRAVRCAPFQLKLYTTMQERGVFLGAIAGDSGIKNQYTRSPLSELVAENDLLWLINVGVLRREVDGQGITDSFRLTPLGRQLVREWQENEVRMNSSTWGDRVSNFISRWVRFPF